MPYNVLLIDADAGRLAAMRKLLMEHGDCAVSTVTTAVAGIREIVASRFDLAIVNTTLQRERDGVKLVQLLLVEQKVSRCPPILVLSGEQDPAIIKACAQAGVADFVAEPADWFDLLPRVQKVLERHGSLHERLVRIMATFVGPAARVFLQKGANQIGGGLDLKAVTPEHMPDLIA